MSRESKAAEWAAIAVQFHQKAEAKGIKIPFPDLCFCIGRPHLWGAAPNRTLTTALGVPIKEITTHCPVVSPKTLAARHAALGALIHA